MGFFELKNVRVAKNRFMDISMVIVEPEAEETEGVAAVPVAEREDFAKVGRWHRRCREFRDDDGVQEYIEYKEI